MPEGVSVSGIEFTIKGNADKASESIDKLIEKLNALQQALAAIGSVSKSASAFKNFASGINEIKGASKGSSTTLSKLAEGLVNVAAASELLGEKSRNITELAIAVQRISENKVNTSSLKNLAEGLQAVGMATWLVTDEAIDKLERMTEALAKLSGVDLKGLGSAMKGVNNNAKQKAPPVPVTKDLEDMIRNGDQIDLLKIKLADLGNSLKNAFAKGDVAGAVRIRQQMASVEAQIEKLEAAVERPKSALEKIGAVVSKVEGAMGSVFRATIKVSGALLKVGFTGAKAFGNAFLSPIKKATKNVAGMAKSVGGVLAGFKRIAGYRIMRTIIKEITQGFSEGTKNLYEWSRLMGGAANASGQTFAQALDSIATSMLYFKNSVGAAVSPLISAFAPAIDFVVDKLVTFLNLINQLLAKLSGASTWNRAKKKATEFGDAVSGAGQAAKEALHYLAPFDELNVLPDQKDKGGSGGAAEDYSDMFEEVTEFNQGIADFADAIKEKVANGDWQGLGQLLGGKVNDVVNSIDFAGIGAKVGTGINAWFTTKYWTLETINFQNIGSKIAEFLNNAISNIDFNVLGRLITQKWTIVGDFLIGAIETINWGQVTSKLSDFIIGSFDQLSEWIQSVDWAEFGSTLWSSLKDAVEGVDFGGIARSLMTLLGSAIAGASQLVYNFVRDAVHDIWGYFLGFAQDENGDGEIAGGEILEGVLKGMINAFKNIKTWIRENIFTPFINAFKNVFGIHSPAETMEEPGQYVGEGILAGILKPFKQIKAWVKEHIVDPLSEAIKEKIAEAKELVNIGLDIMSNMLTGIQDGWTLIKAWFSDNFVRGMQQFGIDAVNGLLQHIEDAVNGAINTINGMIDDLPDVIKDKLGITHIDPIDIKMIPDLDPPVGTFYNETKQKLEEESKKKAVTLTSKANVSDFTYKFTGSKATAQGNPIFDARARFVGQQQGLFKGNYATSGGNPIFDSRARFVGQQQGLFKGQYATSGGNPIFDARARFVAQQQGLFKGSQATQYGNPQFDSRANFIAYGQNFGGRTTQYGNPIFYSQADFTGYQVNLGTPSISSTAYFDDWQNGLNYKPSINVDAYVDNIYSDDGNLKYNASGGVFSGGQWHDIAAYASGGSPNTAQMFIAREAGPELVGTLGGHTAVMNNDQIVSSVSSGVAKAISQIRFHMTGLPSAPPVSTESEMSEESIYRAMLRALNDSDVFPDEIDLDGDVVYRKMIAKNQLNTRMTGRNAMTAMA